MNPLEAYHTLMQFAQRRGEGAVQLASHAAVPQSFRADLLHLLRVNFVPEVTHDPAVEADVLLAPFCEDIGGGYFQFDAEARKLLLDTLAGTYKQEKRGTRIQRVAHFLLAYIEQSSRTFREYQDQMARDYLEVQRWVALAFLDPAAAAEQLAAALAQATSQSEPAVRVQLGGLVSGLTLPLVNYPQLLTYAAGVQAFEAGQMEHGRELLERLPDEDMTVGRVKLRSPHKILRQRQIENGDEPKKTVRGQDPGETTTEPRRLKIFLCYSPADKPTVRDLYKRLQADGFDPWLDEEELIPGQDWQREIPKAVRASDVIIACLSGRSITKEGYVQKEITYALDVADEKPEGTIFLIPLKLEECQIPERLQRWQWCNLFEEKGYEKLRRALRLRAEGLGVALQETPQVITNSIGMELVRIPAGEFLMGSDNGNNDERPRHQVRISQPFYLGKYPVTQKQWEIVMGSNPSHFEGDLNRPVESVSWHEVQEFLRKLSEREGGKPYRLPTEAEWEYAARAGTTTLYYFGDDESQLREYAWYGENAGETTHPVGQLTPNAWGLYDMLGNVWEWCADWYGGSYYQQSPAQDPKGPEKGNFKVLRGGSWLDDPWSVRVSGRSGFGPGNRLDHLGFRCAQ